MKKILFILLSVTFFPSFACAQQIDSVVSKLLISLEEEKWDDVVDLFHQFADEDVENAEVFYWVKAANNEEISSKLLLDLAQIYYKEGQFDKSLFMYREYCDKTECSANDLLDIAQVIIDLGDVHLTEQIYEKIATLDPENLNANIFLGNYAYLRAERERKRIEYEFKRIKKPTRMEYAQYRQKLKDLYLFSYTHAQSHLKTAYRKLKSEEIKNTLDHIDVIKDISI